MKLRAENVLLAIQIELDDVPHDHQNQDDQQDDVDVEQGEDEEIVDQRHRIVQLLDEDFNRRQKGQADHDQPDDEAVALSFLFDFCGHALKKGDRWDRHSCLSHHQLNRPLAKVQDSEECAADRRGIERQTCLVAATAPYSCRVVSIRMQEV